MRLSDEEGARWGRGLERALRALRLNACYPPWRALAGHLRAASTAAPGQGLALCPHTLWPHPDEWLRAVIDRELAPSLLPQLAPLVSAGDVAAARKAAYLQALLEAGAPVRSQVSAALVERAEEGLRLEVVIDRQVPEGPRFERWTFRLTDARGRLESGGGGARLEAGLERQLLALCEGPAAAAAAALLDDRALSLEELVRGEIGPALRGGGGPALTAALERAAPHLTRTHVDDPLAGEVAVPEAGAGFGLSRQRKWAAPTADREAWRAWLDERGSRNLIYTYAL